MNRNLLFALPLLAVFTVSGCSKSDREFHSKPIEPSIAGVWAGTMQINGVSSAIQITLEQNNIAVKGSYTADGASPALAGSGTLNGATTGPTFSLDITGNLPACLGSLKMGGENNGAALSFNLVGTDCNGATLRGEAFLSKR